jgi:myo-inositol-1(or 4)-monophosphatase
LPAVEESRLPDVGEDLVLLLDAARQAGVIAMGYFGNSPEVWMKGGTSPVSEADYAADKYLRETLLAARPDYGWLSEETADDLARLSAPRTFVVDPIDGTRGFLQGLDTWCVSVAVVERGKSLVGVLECPAKQETYRAVRGEGAFLNARPIHVNRPGQMLQVAGPQAMIDRLSPEWQERLTRIPHIPSLAYRLAMVASGTLDATFVKPNAHDWDIAAADLILREAGGELTGRDGQAPNYGGEAIRHGALAAGSGELFAALADIVATLDR